MSTTPILVLTNADNVSLDLTDCDPTFEQTVTADLIDMPVPTEPPTGNDYSGGDAGGAVAFNMLLFDDIMTITCLFKQWEYFWLLYEWMKFDERLKHLTWGEKYYAVHIKRLSGSVKPGQGTLISVNIGLRVVNVM